MSGLRRWYFLLLAAAGLSLAVPAAAQTVIYPDPPPAAGRDSARPAGPTTGRADTTGGPARAAQAAPPAAVPVPPPPAPVMPADPVVSKVCSGAVPGESAPDVLGIVFTRASKVEAREAAIAAAGGKRLAGTAEDEFQYVQVPAGGNEFRLRTVADRIIRLAGVSEVGPVTCPATAPPQTPGPPAAAPRDSAAPSR